MNPPLWSVIPFAVLLLCIALGPLLAPHFWERHYAKISVGLGAIVVLYYLLEWRAGARVLHSLEEYIGFILLIGSLFVIAGGIDLRLPSGTPTPFGNVLFLAAGSLLANGIGTTGASMVLIRPWLRRNQERIAPYHAVFFIFTVSNVGGCLTPVGDPPLFLGYLNHIPFLWTLLHLDLPWAVALAGVLSIFYLLDWRAWQAAGKKLSAPHGTWSLKGWQNLPLLGLVLTAMFLPAGWRDGVMAAALALSLWLTPRAVRMENRFTFAPAAEVAWLFAGIFATMMPALDFLERHGAELGVDSAGKFYWVTGGLSAVLDNAPTYLALLSVSLGEQGRVLGDAGAMAAHLRAHALAIEAISTGAVFFGALTYIGNGPNFMVRAIAQESGLRMPGFFGYLFRYALPFLLPVLLLVYLLFFRSV